ncbi:hypothetical protein EDD11_003064 [Mortierella claussenii]|nr:hypothetical protein EDD11_003064 [Mortierella claussenii]
MTMIAKGYTFCYYVSGHGFGHATRVNQIITELLQSSTASLPTAVADIPVKDGISVSTTLTTKASTTAGAGSNATGLATAATTIESVLESVNNNSINSHQVDHGAPAATTTTTTRSTARHTIYIVSDAPQFIFQDVIALGAIYRNAKIDAGVVQPLAYSVDRQKTIEGVKSFLAKRDEMIQHEVAWLAQVGANCVLADAPFLPCAAASAYGIPACLITNFTFDEVYRFLREGDPMDKDVIACADAALADYKKASLLLRLPGSIDIPSFQDEISELETGVSSRVKSTYSMGEIINGVEHAHMEENELVNGVNSQLLLHPSGKKNPPPKLSVDTSIVATTHTGLQRRAIDVPLVVRKAINTREDVLRSLGVDDETIRTKKMVLVSFGGQRLKQGWGNPLPPGWIGVICGLPVSHELPDGFYRSPHGVYVPDLTHAADIVIGKLGYGTCSECIAHDTALIYVSRPQFIEEHGLIKLMVNHGLPVEMTAEEFETGLWQRSIIEADRLAQEEKEGRRLFLKALREEEAAEAALNNMSSGGHESPTLGKHARDQEVMARRRRSSNAYQKSFSLQRRTPKAKSLAESVNMAEMARGGPISPMGLNDDEDSPLLSPARSRRSASISSLTSATFKSRSGVLPGASGGSGSTSSLGVMTGAGAGAGTMVIDAQESIESAPVPWFERRIPHDGGKVCAQLVEEYMRIWDEYHPIKNTKEQEQEQERQQQQQQHLKQHQKQDQQQDQHLDVDDVEMLGVS